MSQGWRSLWGPSVAEMTRRWSSQAVWALWQADQRQRGQNPRQTRDVTLLWELGRLGNADALSMLTRLLQAVLRPQARAGVRKIEAYLKDKGNTV